MIMFFRKVWFPSLFLLLVALLAWLIAPMIEWPASWKGPKLELNGQFPPLVLFQEHSLHDPGMHRLLLKIDGPPLPMLRARLSEAVSAKTRNGSWRAVPFVQVWDHEQVIEIRIPLVDPRQRDEIIDCRVTPLATNFVLEARHARQPDLILRDLITTGSEAWLTVANLSDQDRAIDSLRLNGVELPPIKPIRVPSHGLARIRVQDAPPAGAACSVILMADGQWIQAAEVAAEPGFFLTECQNDTRPELHLDPAGPLRRQGGPIFEIDIDFCAVERERGLPIGTYLDDARRMLERLPSALDDRPPIQPASRPAALIHLHAANRPRSHYVYGRLSDYVGCSTFEIQAAGGTLEDVLYWLSFDRALIEPARQVVLPGLFVSADRPADRLPEMEIRRLIFACLSVAPRGLMYCQRADTKEAFGYGGLPAYERAIAEAGSRIQAVRPLLEAAFPVKWIHRREDRLLLPDHYGATGFFALWCRMDRLLIVSLGYDQPAWLQLPAGLSLKASEDSAALVLERESAGIVRLDNRRAGTPSLTVLPLDAGSTTDGMVEWVALGRNAKANEPLDRGDRLEPGAVDGSKGRAHPLADTAIGGPASAGRIAH